MTTNDLRQKVLDDMYSLGEMYLSDGNVDEAVGWFEAMLYYGYDGANYFGSIWDDELIVDTALGDMFRYGQVVKRDIYTAVKMYEVEANRGSRAAMIALGEIYRDGEGGIKPDGKKAIEYFMELALGGGDYFFATDTKLYGDGQNVPMSSSERDYFFSFDTANGYDKAKLALGCMYLYGQSVAKNVYKAAWWFAKTDELHCYDSGEIFDLAEMYRTGDGVERDVDVAVAWYEWIIEYNTDAKTLFALAEIYFHGDGVERDVDKALNYYEQAAECGNVKAAYTLSEIYREGNGVKKNLSKSREFLDATIKALLNKIKT